MSNQQPTPGRRPRAREVGLRPGTLPPGHFNAITDVAGVRVGHTTVWFGEGALRPGEGPARTGVTAILPHSENVFLQKVPAAIDVINGFGKCTGIAQVNELGTLEAPIVLTNTLCVGRAADALITHAIRETPQIGVTTGTVNPVVGECNDGFLNDIQGRHVTEAHVLAAIDGATGGRVLEGAVGAGAGMTAFGFKGGIGTASRVIGGSFGGYTVGVLVLANFGTPRQLLIDGVPVGRMLAQERATPPEDGSIMIIVATDAPLLDRGLRRLARRAGFGLARTGSEIGHGSGDMVIAFSTAPAVRIPHFSERRVLSVRMLAEGGVGGDSSAIDALFQAAVEATEEAILNALFAAETVTGRDGRVVEALPIERVEALLAQTGRLSGRRHGNGSPGGRRSGETIDLDAMPVYWINLDRRTDRRESMEAQLAGRSGPSIRIPATDAATVSDADCDRYMAQLSPIQVQRRVEWQWFEPKAEIGCLRSHVVAMEAMIERGEYPALILEDDAVLPVIRQIPAPPEDWDVLLIGGRHNPKPPPLDGDVAWYRFTDGIWYQSMAFVVRNPAAADALRACWQLEAQPADLAWGDLLKRLVTYAPNGPILVANLDSPSSIADRKRIQTTHNQMRRRRSARPGDAER